MAKDPTNKQVTRDTSTFFQWIRAAGYTVWISEENHARYQATKDDYASSWFVTAAQLYEHMKQSGLL